MGHVERSRPCVLVSCNNYNELPHVSGLNNTDLLSYSCKGQASEMGLIGLKSRLRQGYSPFWRL